MNRRKSLIVALLCVAANGVMAQSVEDGLKDIYYGKYKSAKETLEKAAAAKPDDRAYYYLGIAELGLENKDGAAAAFQKGLTAVPNSPLLQVGMGRLDLINGNAPAAKQKFDAASTATEGRNGDVARAIADANSSIKGGDRGYALSVMEKLLNNEGRKKKEQYTAIPADYIELGDAYRVLGGENGGKAITTYEKALELDPNNAEAVYKQGLVNYNAKLLQEAVNDWTKAGNMDPKYGPAFFELFEFYITPKKQQLSWDNAAIYLQKYMEVADPADKLKNEYYLAAISFYKKDYDAAINKAKTVLPQVAAADKGKFTRLMADAYLQKGDSMTAKSTMDEYVKGVGDSKLEALDYKLLSEIYGRVKITDSTQAAITDSLASLYLERYANLDTTKDVDHYREVAEKFKSLRDYARSAEWYGKLTTDFPDDVNTGKIQDYFWKGTMEIYANNPTAADSTFGTFVAKYPTQEALGLYWRGRANMLNDKEAKEGSAVPYFQKFFEVGGESKMKGNQLMYPYQYMMIYYYNKEDKDNLKTWMDKVLALNPNDPAAKQIQENIASTAKPAKAGAKPASNGGNKK
ncbi:tetratricopeptide repeat protein [Chitinophaga agrisoli]|uniref:Tetratricopeptide repeat protein n=1 Tax=Chitinophaga agrisoli TaxID=2607653 RepID=A0A5B2VPL4_9BACT|nr:tetratricopeptide repeat protein [Chitinophaga agrisoli]KAA2240608.1 tetratricopeptide repeat protein [Chitinophaga agrisoli]